MIYDNNAHAASCFTQYDALHNTMPKQYAYNDRK